MSDVFISYGRSTAREAQAIAEALRALGYAVWRDDDLPAHRPYAEVIQERLLAAKAVVVVWSAEAARSEWVQSEADRARTEHKLVQLRIDDAALPMPFDRIQCADLQGWKGDPDAPGWRNVISSLSDLIRGAPAPDVGGAAAKEPALPDKPSIAVLPFTDMTGAKECDYFCDGMVMEIVTALSRFSSLFVIASDSSLSYRDGAYSRKHIARDLGVRYLLDGSVRRSGDKVRIAVQLVDAIVGAPVWNARFDGTLEDVFLLQDTVADGVAAQIAPTVVGVELRRARARPTKDLSAYDLYLRARFGVDNKAKLLNSISLLKEAIARDPRYALALAYQADCHALLATWGYSEAPAESWQTSRDLARRALRLRGDDAEVLLWAGAALGRGGNDLAVAQALVERSLTLNPGDSQAWQVSGALNAYAGRPGLALEQLETGLRLNPRDRLLPILHIGWSLLFLRRFAEAIPFLREAGDLHPDFEGPAVALIAVYGHLGRIDEAKAVLATVRPELITAMFGFFRDPDCQAILRSGLALAGVDV